MQPVDLYRALGNLLGSADAAQVLSALRQDALVWEALETAEVWEQASQAAGKQVSRWTPGLIGLLAGGCKISPEILNASPMAALPTELHERVFQAYQNAQPGSKPAHTLQEAVFLALALRERRRLTGNWNGLLGELQTRAGQGGAFPQVWRTAVACLVGLVPDPEDLLRALLPRMGARSSYEWLTHAQLSQPASNTGHVEAFTHLLQGQPVALQLGVLRSLTLHGRTEITESLAEALLVGHPAIVMLRNPGPLGDLDLPGIAARALTMQQMASLYQLSGNRSQAQSMLKSAEQTMKHWLAGLYLQELHLDSFADMPTSAGFIDEGKISLIVRDGAMMKSELGAVMTTQYCLGSLTEQMEAGRQDPFLQIKLAGRLMQDGNTSMAQDLARQGVAALIDTLQQTGQPFCGEFVYAWQPMPLIQAVVNLGLASEALQLALALNKVRPTDTALLLAISYMYETAGDMQQACRFAQASVSLEPHIPNWRRRLGQLRASVQEWNAALEEYEMVLALSNPPTLEDRLAYARVALKNNAFASAREVCEVILGENPDNGQAAGLLGETLLGLGEREEAKVYLSRATLLAPEVLSPWLALAALQQDEGDHARALETLRAAVIASPDEVEGHLALSNACLAEGMLSEALPHLKQAFHLKPGSDTTAFLYGKTLRDLGHTAEARSVLDKTRLHWTRRPDMAYEFALTALDQHDFQGALPALEVALRAPEAPLDWHLLFARVLLDDMGSSNAENKPEIDSAAHETRCRQAETALLHVIDADAENFEAKFLLANLHLQRNRLEDALDAFSSISENRDPAYAEYRWRVQWGLGRAALRFGQIDTALAALKEAAQARPDCIDLQRSLAEASLRANLSQAAEAAAEYALQLAPDSVENLIWFAETMTALDLTARAAEALACAVELDSRQAHLRIKLAQLQVESGNLAAAKSCLENLSELDDTTSEDLRSAAHTYLRMQDPITALSCLERALKIDAERGVQPAMDVLYETARLRDQLGNPKGALDLAQQALSRPEDADRLVSLPFYQMQADLLARLGRPQAALASLEKALLIVPRDAQGKNVLPDSMNGTLSQVHQTFTHLLVESGNLAAALMHAEEALELAPDQIAFRLQAAQLAFMMLQIERAEQLSRYEQLSAGSDPQAFDLQALAVEIHLFAGHEDQARSLLNAGLVLAPDHPRLLAAHARLAAAENDLPEAQRLFEQVLNQTGEQPEPAVWLAEAALSAQEWRVANRFFEQYRQLHPEEAMAYLGLARSLVLSAEHQRACELLHCRTNTPGSAALSDAAYRRFEEALAGLEERSSTPEARRWQARGQAVFRPGLPAARALIAYVLQPEDAAALVGLMRQMGNRTAALQTARHHPNDPRVQFALGLCYLNTSSQEAASSDLLAEDGLALASSLVDAVSGQPLYYALLAYLTRQDGKLQLAYQAFCDALACWPEEAAWHDAAGDLALALGDPEAALIHREQALALDPGNVRAALKLGQVCLAEDRVGQAVAVLEKASAMGNDQADVWLTLARAYLADGRLPQALDAALLAADIDRLSAQGYLVAGETALMMHQTEQALELANNAIQREPESPAVYLFLCRVHDHLGNPREALAVLEQASPAVRQDFQVAFERARLIHDLYGAQSALETLERLAQDFPEEPDLIAYLARTQAECGDIRLAERHAFKALRLNPDQPDLALMLGRLQRKSGQLDHAVHLLSEVVRMAPDQLEAYLELGAVYQDRREFDQALRVYQQAIQVAPNDYQAYFQSGIILRDNKDYAGSEQMLRQAAELAPDNPTIRRQLIAVITLNLVHKK